MRTLIACLALVSLTSSLRGQADDSTGRSSLRGVSGVYVLVEYVDTSLAGYGLTREVVQTAAEVKLRAAGIPVLTQQEALLLPGQPFLYVNLQIVKRAELHLLIFNLTVQFVQNVHLDRNPSLAVYVPTWGALPQVGSTGTAHAHGLLDYVNNEVDQFINAYLTANPKQ